MNLYLDDEEFMKDLDELIKEARTKAMDAASFSNREVTFFSIIHYLQEARRTLEAKK
jgi:hypothetical protein